MAIEIDSNRGIVCNADIRTRILPVRHVPFQETFLGKKSNDMHHRAAVLGGYLRTEDRLTAGYTADLFQDQLGQPCQALTEMFKTISNLFRRKHPLEELLGQEDSLCPHPTGVSYEIEKAKIRRVVWNDLYITS